MGDEELVEAVPLFLQWSAKRDCSADRFPALQSRVVNFVLNNPHEAGFTLEVGALRQPSRHLSAWPCSNYMCRLLLCGLISEKKWRSWDGWCGRTDLGGRIRPWGVRVRNRSQEGAINSRLNRLMQVGWQLRYRKSVRVILSVSHFLQYDNTSLINCFKTISMISA